MAEIRWSLRAAEDLLDIEEFVARDSPVYAVRLTDRIVEAVERLETFPLSGRMVPEFEREDLRELIFGSYRVSRRAAARTWRSRATLVDKIDSVR